MPTSFNFNWYDARAFASNERKAQFIEQLYQEALKEAARIAASINHAGGKFSFDKYPRLQKQVDDLFRDLAGKMQSTISSGTLEAWTLSNAKNDALIDYLHESTGVDKSILRDKYKWGVRNNEALAAFQNRTTQGLDLSKRVWNIAGQTKKEFEAAIGGSFTEGNSAAKLAREMRKFLANPNNIPADVNPGRGVYRSPVKNAQRLTRTEINMAYREADHLRWAQMDFVLGIEIRLSNNPNHCPTCAALKGKYPKTYKFVGWHPQCRCYAVPILMSDAEFIKMVNGEEVTPSNPIDTPPDNYHSWLDQNADKIQKAKSVPYFLKDNSQFASKPLQAKLIEHIPEGIKDYQMALGITIDNDIFSLLNKPVTFDATGTRGAYYVPGKEHVVIPVDARRKRSKWKAESTVYHEFGHAADWQNNIKDMPEVADAMDKFRKQFAKDGDRLYKEIDERLYKLGYYAYQKGWNDLVQQAGAAHDTLMSLNPKFGAGHSKEYWKIKGNKEAEFIAHMFENKYIGNPAFKKVMPDLYEEMIKLADTIRNKINIANR